MAEAFRRGSDSSRARISSIASPSEACAVCRPSVAAAVPAPSAQDRAEGRVGDREPGRGSFVSQDARHLAEVGPLGADQRRQLEAAVPGGEDPLLGELAEPRRPSRGEILAHAAQAVPVGRPVLRSQNAVEVFHGSEHVRPAPPRAGVAGRREQERRRLATQPDQSPSGRRVDLRPIGDRVGRKSGLRESRVHGDERLLDVPHRQSELQHLERTGSGGDRRPRARVPAPLSAGSVPRAAPAPCAPRPRRSAGSPAACGADGRPRSRQAGVAGARTARRSSRAAWRARAGRSSLASTRCSACTARNQPPRCAAAPPLRRRRG